VATDAVPDAGDPAGHVIDASAGPTRSALWAGFGALAGAIVLAAVAIRLLIPPGARQVPSAGTLS
jgi:hypothetical protein